MKGERNLKAEKQGAFTLAELTVVIAIIGILAAISLPSYLHTVKKTRRADAEDGLQLFRQAMERHYSKAYTYRRAAQDGGDTGLPAVFHETIPIDGGSGGDVHYNLSITRAGDDCFELRATPAAGSMMVDDPCGTLYLNHAGQRGSSENSGLCWNGSEGYALMTEADCG